MRTMIKILRALTIAKSVQRGTYGRRVGRRFVQNIVRQLFR